MTNDEGQMTNRWGRLKVSRRWVIVVAAAAIIPLLAYALFRKPAVTLEVIELKQELLRGFQADSYAPSTYHRTNFELHWVAELELRNNSSKEILYEGFFSNHKMPDFDCLHWTNSSWVRDSGMAAGHLAVEDHYKRGGVGGSGLVFKPVGLPPGGSLRFRVELYERGKPSLVVLPFRISHPKVKFYDLLPYAVVDHLPWRKEWHLVKTEVILNGAKELPPWWTSKPGNYNRYKPF